ncbi:MAG: hypothetical protein HGA99_00835 [Chlorobiaceae bacterium]|nr:hypothetical protein [Chlorobiaceae bacterium]
MKLILKQYLSSLKERDELDAILPDLLSQLGLNVFSRPGRGTRQYGVDVGAVGSLDGGQEKVYLFSIKQGDLTRIDWDGNSLQSLRQSLNQIVDAYISNYLPAEYHDKDVVICICIGGDVQEQVRLELESYIKQHSNNRITFSQWNGDELATRIQSCFLREELLPVNARSRLRKSLALLDEPEASFQHFAALVKSLSVFDDQKDTSRVTALRQISICLWILFSWARDANNMEAAYLSSELTLLHAWKIGVPFFEAKGKIAEAISTSIASIFSVYSQICNEYLVINVLPHTSKLHALSSAVRASCSLDVNLKLFDLLGRLAIGGIWAYWGASHSTANEDLDAKKQLLQESSMYSESLKQLINSNPVLLLPVKDEQAIDIFTAVFLLSFERSNHDYLKKWLAEIVTRSAFALQTNGRYPCNLDSYSDLLSHPKSGDTEYLKNVTKGSILFPVIALWAALLDDEEMYKQVALLKEKHLNHCGFQVWFPDEISEEHFYTNSDTHGAALPVCVEKSREEFLAPIFSECDQSQHFKKMSAIKYNWWPLLIVACRHYRLPLPPNLLEGLRNKS